MRQGAKKLLRAQYSAEYYLRKIKQLKIPPAEKSIIASTLWMDAFSNCPPRDHISGFDEYLEYPVENYDHNTVVKGLLDLGFGRQAVEERLLSEKARKSLARKPQDPINRQPSIFKILQSA